MIISFDAIENTLKLLAMITAHIFTGTMRSINKRLGNGIAENITLEVVITITVSLQLLLGGLPDILTGCSQ